MEWSELPRSTASQARISSTRFKKWLVEHRLPSQIESMPTEHLARYLRAFYSALQNKSEGLYSPSTLLFIHKRSWRGGGAQAIFAPKLPPQKLNIWGKPFF